MRLGYAVWKDSTQGTIEILTDAPQIEMNPGKAIWIKRDGRKGVEVPFGAFPVMREHGHDGQVLMVLDIEDPAQIACLANGLVLQRIEQYKAWGWELRPSTSR